MESPNTTDYLLARGAAEDVAVVDAGRHYSYGDLRAAVAKLVAALSVPDLTADRRRELNETHRSVTAERDARTAEWGRLVDEAAADEEDAAEGEDAGA